MDLTTVFRAFCLLCILQGSRQLSITELEVPSAVQAGENVELKCEYSLDGQPPAGLYVKWWWTPADASDLSHRTSVQLYQRIAGYPPQILHAQTTDFHIEMKEQDTILLMNIEPKHSGIYECEVSNLDEVRKHQKLVVYTKGSGPRVNVSLIEEESSGEEPGLLVECEASQVAPEPTLAITLDGQVLNSSETVSEPVDGVYSISANASIPSGAGAELRCELFYDDKNISHPAYIDTLIYSPAGAAGLAAEPTDASPQPEPDSTPSIPDDSNRRSGAIWMVLVSAILSTVSFRRMGIL